MNVWEVNLFMVNYIIKVGKNKRKSVCIIYKILKYIERISDCVYVK